MSELIVDDLTLAIRRSPRRRTMQITVDRDGSLLVTAPPETDHARLTEFVREKQFWIYKKLAEKAQLQGSLPRKEFVNGEGFLYLGRSYRLRIVDEQDERLKLVAGRFNLRRSALPEARDAFVRWYGRRGHVWLSTKVQEHAPAMEVDPAEIRVQDLGYRWGSCGKGKRVYFHWKTMLLPREIAEYVVVHELVHLHEPHHTPAFWSRLERAMPDFDRRKAWLAKHGRQVDTL